MRSNVIASLSATMRGRVAAAAAGGGGGVPLWLSGKSVNAGFLIGSTRSDTLIIASRGMPYNFSGGDLDVTNNTMYVWGGGRADCNDNSVFNLDLRADAPAWARISTPSSVGAILDGQATNSDGRPNARHTYYLITFNPIDRLLHITGGTGMVDQSSNTTQHDVYDPVANSWSTKAACPASGMYDSPSWTNPVTGDIFCANHSPAGLVGRIYQWTRSTDTWSTPVNFGSNDSPGNWSYDGGNNRAFKPPDAAGTSGPKEVDMATGTITTVTLSGTSLPNSSYSMAFDDILGCHWAHKWDDGTLYKFVRNSSSSYTVSVVTPSGTAPGGSSVDPSNEANYRGYGRFRYVKFGSIGGLFFNLNFNSNCWFMRTA